MVLLVYHYIKIHLFVLFLIRFFYFSFSSNETSMSHAYGRKVRS